MDVTKQKVKAIRDETDFRSPGTEVTPMAPSRQMPRNVASNAASNIMNDIDAEADTTSNNGVSMPATPLPERGNVNGGGAEVPSPLADFIAQTDANGVASTPRSAVGVRMTSGDLTPKKQQQALQIEDQKKPAVREGASKKTENDQDYGDSFLDTIKSMCCCFIFDDDVIPSDAADHQVLKQTTTKETIPDGVHNRDEDMEEFESPQPQAISDGGSIRLLPSIHPDDKGKKCLVLDLDETLVHSSFRAVPGADFVIPVQIEEVVHFVYVAKRPGVDRFLTEMAKHYEIVIYTASLNKYADPLLDLLDPGKVIRARLFRESCVFHEGNYVKDLSLINRDLSQSIIVDNSPSSYIFHPENAIDCTSFIDDVTDCELDQIGNFLAGVKNVKDVRHVCKYWKDWPNVNIEPYL